MLQGYATLEATNRYRTRFLPQAEAHFRQIPDLVLSSIGIGTYLGEADSRTDENYTNAIVRAVELGVNVIDSAANYRFQRSERSIGAALGVLINDRGFAREEILICTKGGYLPFDGAPPRDVRAYVEESFVKPGIASLDEIVGGSHCMTPAYLENQLEQSRSNLQVDCIDLYYVHNPESQLGYVTMAEFEKRLRRAFEFLEQARAQQRIRMYGVATWNGFRLPEGSRQFHSLTRMVEIASEVGGAAHGFRVIQLPFNLAMPEAVTLENHIVNGQPASLLEAAAAFDVMVMTSASILQGRVARDLPEHVRTALGSLPTDAQTAIQFVRSTPGITTALVGMSNTKHVAENLKLATIPPVTQAEFARLFSG